MSDRPIFGPDALRDQLQKLDELPANEAHAGVVVENGDLGAEAEGKIDLGTSGGFVEAEASIFRRAGWRVAAAIGWRRRTSAGPNPEDRAKD